MASIQLAYIEALVLVYGPTCISPPFQFLPVGKLCIPLPGVFSEPKVHPDWPPNSIPC